MKLARLSLVGDVRTGFRNYIIHSSANREAVRKTLAQRLPKQYYRDPANLDENCTDAAPSTDDWPFAFLVVASMPFAYLYCLVLLLLTIIAEASAFEKREAAPATKLETAEADDLLATRRRLGLMALAAAFMLSCDKAMSTLAFNFGSVWQVAAVGAAAFFALAACACALRSSRLKIHGAVFWLLFMVSLAADYLFNYEALVSIPQPALRLAAGGLLPLLPVFFSGAVLSGRIDRRGPAAIDLGFVFLGFAAGLILDAISMYRGVAGLDLAVAVISISAFVLMLERRRGEAASQEMVESET